MTFSSLDRRNFLKAAAASGASCLAAGAYAIEPNAANLKEPVHRVAKANNTNPQPAVPVNPNPHPLDPALDMARDALKRIQVDVVDYTCRITKQERINGQLGQQETMEAKVRNRKVVDGKLVKPLSVYLKFKNPRTVEGREVVWVERENNNKLRAHEGGVKGRFLPSVWLDPDGALAMNGQLHPIYDIGIENLVLKLIERGEKEKKFGDPKECEVTFIPNATIKLGQSSMTCTVIQVLHPVQRPHFEFYRAEIFIDDALKIPVRYAAYLWPAQPGGELPVIESYTYTNVKLNPGLENIDFDSTNPAYNF